MFRAPAHLASVMNADLESMPRVQTPLTLVEDRMQVYPQALSPLVFHENTNEFQPTTHQNTTRPKAGTSPSIGYFKESATGALWVGKMSVASGEKDPQMQAYIEIIAAGIYAYYGVPVPRLAIGKQLPVNPEGEWVSHFRAANIRHATHLLSRWLGRFTPYGEQNSPKVMKQCWLGTRANQFTLLIDGRPIPERGLGKILAVAQWLNHNDVIGGSGGNVGYEFQTDLQGQLYARSCKIDTGDAFFEFQDMKGREVASKIRISRNDPAGVELSSLPEVTRQEFLLTLAQIIKTPESVLRQFFTREGSACLLDPDNKTAVDATIGSVDWAIITLNARRNQLQTHYKVAIQEAVTRYEQEQHQPESSIQKQQNSLSCITDDNIRLMCNQALFAYNQVEMQQALYFYIEADGISHPDDLNRTKLVDTLYAFLNQSTERVLLLLGESGSGKSIAAQKFLYQLWQQYIQNPTSKTPVPLLIELKRFTELTVGQCIDRVLQEEYHFTQQQIERHKQTSSFVFILDGYDEIGRRPEMNLYHSNRLDEWLYAKIIITCRSTDKAATRLPLFSPGTGAITGLQARYLAPFSVEQIQMYINKQSAEVKTHYQRLLEQQPDIINLIENPFILILIVHALPVLLARSTARGPMHSVREAPSIMNRDKLYLAFMQQWFMRQEVRLTTFLGELPPATIQTTFQSFAAELSFAMFISKNICIQDNKAPVSPWQRFFSPREGADFYARLACPLKTQGDGYSFIHKSFFEYFAATYLWMALDKSLPEALGEWNKRPLTDETAIMQFLADKLANTTNRRAQEEKLLALVLSSRGHSEYAAASAGAITVLNFSRFSFSGLDLSGIYIPNADLSFAVLHGTSFRNADLTRVNFSDAWMGHLDCSGSLMKGVHLGRWPILNTTGGIISLSFHPKMPFICAFVEDKYMAAICAFQEFQERISRDGRNFHDAIMRHMDGRTDKFSVEDLVAVLSGIPALPAPALPGNPESDQIAIVNLQTGEYLKKLAGHDGRVTSICFAPEGTLLASGGSDRTVRIWPLPYDENLLPPYEPRLLTGHTDSITCVHCSSNGRLVASGSDDNIVRIWDILNERSIELIGHTAKVASVHFSPTGEQLASGSSDNTVRIWNVAGEGLRIFSGHTKGVTSVHFSPNGRELASGSNDRTVRVWNLINGESYILDHHTNHVDSVHFSPNGLLLASGTSEGIIYLWDTNSWQPHIVEEQFLSVRSVSSSKTIVQFSPTGEYLAVAIGDKTVRVFNIISRKIRALETHTSYITSIQFSSDGERLMTGGIDNVVRLWDMLNGQMQIFKGHSNAVKSVAFSRIGNLFSAGADNTVRIWDPHSEKCLGVLNGHTGSVNSVSWSLGYIASGSTDKTIRMWNTRNNLCIWVLHQHTDSVNSVKFSPNEKLLASGSDDCTVRIWCDWPADRIGYICIYGAWWTCVLTGHTGGVTNITFSPTGERLASSSYDRTVRVWDIADRRSCVLRGHIQLVRDVQFSQTGERLASASDDKTVRVWDVASRTCLTVIEMPLRVLCLSWRYNKLAMAGENGFLSCWHLTSSNSRSAVNAYLQWIPRPYFACHDMQLHGVREISSANSRLLIQGGAHESAQPTQPFYTSLAQRLTFFATTLKERTDRSSTCVLQ